MQRKRLKISMAFCSIAAYCFTDCSVTDLLPRLWLFVDASVLTDCSDATTYFRGHDHLIRGVCVSANRHAYRKRETFNKSRFDVKLVP